MLSRRKGWPENLGQVILSDRPDLAQFQCNGALAAAKAAKANPRDIAGKDRGPAETGCAFRQDRNRRSRLYQSGSQRCRADTNCWRATARLETGKGKKLVIDFGGPNVAKPMHVGHLRSSIIGDCLQRLYRANGWAVTGDVHLGDWGLQMGQLISEDGIARAGAGLFRRGVQWSVPGCFAR